MSSRRLMRVSGFAVLLLGAAAAGAVLLLTDTDDSTRAVAPPSSSGPAAPSGTIVFQAVRDRLGVPELLTVTVPGGKPKPLRGRRFHGIEPAYSRDGSYLAFGKWLAQEDDRSGRHGNTLVVARSDGSDVRTVVPIWANEFSFHNSAQWSFDGAQIAVVSSDPARPHSTLNAVAARGGPLRKLQQKELERWAPPNAGRAIHQVGPNRFRVAWFMPGGTKPITLIENASQPVWSPARPEFAYVIRGRLFIFDTVSQRSRRVARSGCFGQAARPAWSPNGDWLAHFLCPGQNRSPQLRIVSRDGKHQSVILRDVVGGYSPSWRR